MFDKFRLKEALVDYKRDFVSNEWANEKFKWEAIKCFQEHWNVNAEDFADMLHRSLDKTKTLLGAVNYFPRRMIEEFAKTAPEDVRGMFIALFDESKDVAERITAFKNASSILLEKYGNGAAQHYQYENAISTYLWLRYPDKYYIYKYDEVKTVADELGSDYVFKKGAYAENIRNFIKLYDEICDELKLETELVNLFKSQLTDECYPDPQLRTLTIDVGFYISRKKPSDEWWPDPAEYTPGLSVEDWETLLQDKEVFTESALEIVKRMLDNGGQATCTQLSIKYGETKNFYNSGSQALARRIIQKTGCAVPEKDTENSKLWPVLYVGKYAGKSEAGSYIWRLRDELSKALDKVDLSGVKLYADGGSVRYWLCAPGDGASIWDECVSEGIIAIGWDQLGNYKQYATKAELSKKMKEIYDSDKNYSSTANMLLNFSSTMKPGDIIFAKKGLYSVVGRGVVESDYIYDESRGDMPNYRRVRWTDVEEKSYPGQAPQKTLTDITEDKDTVKKLNELYDVGSPVQPETVIPPYTREDFLSEVYMSDEKYDRLTGVLLSKKNIILQGAPGVGKTFAAKRLAYSLMGEKDEDRIEFVQFHQSYSYEDFMMGYKPSGDGFELKYGVFYQFCQKAANQPEKKFFFIIDEINRGNLSKIFGELLMLIEKDYRGVKTTLAYNGLSFSVPENLYIIGMMNTADRSLAMIDYALRRRFSFFEIDPGFESKGFSEYQKTLGNDTFNALISKIIELNAEISRDRSLGKGFCIGHSYFCGRTADTCTDDWMLSVVDYDILPMLSEYWFDEENKVQRWDNVLHGVFQ